MEWDGVHGSAWRCMGVHVDTIPAQHNKVLLFCLYLTTYSLLANRTHMQRHRAGERESLG